MIKLSTRYSSRTAADLEVLDQQFKNWLDSIAAVLGHRSTTRKGGVMMTGGKPYGLGTITEYHALPEGSTIMVEMDEVDGNVAMMSMNVTFKESWAKQVAKHNTGDESPLIKSMVRVDDPSRAGVLVEMFNEAVKSVIDASQRLKWFESQYEPSSFVLCDLLGNTLKRNKLVASSSDVVRKPDSYIEVLESGVPYGVGGVLIKDALTQAINGYTNAGRVAPKMATLRKLVLSKVDKMVEKTLGDFMTGHIVSTYLRSATWMGDDIHVSFLLSNKDDGKVRPHHLMGYIASSDMQIRQAYLRHTLKQASRSYVRPIDSDGAAAHGRRLSSTPQRSRSRSVEGCDELANSMVVKLTVGLQTPYSHVRIEKPGYHQQVFKVFLPETGLLYMLVKTQVALDVVESPIQISVTFPEKVPDWAEMKVKEVVGRTDGVILRRKGSPDELIRDVDKMSRAVLNVIRPLVDFVVNRSKVGDQIERVAYDPLNYKVESLLSPHFGSRIEAHSLADGQDGYKGGDFPYLLRHFTIRGILKEDQVADPRFEDEVRSKILSALEPLKTAFNAENLGVDLSEDVIFDYSWEEIQVRFMIYSLDDQNFIHESDRKRELR